MKLVKTTRVAEIEELTYDDGTKMYHVKTCNPSDGSTTSHFLQHSITGASLMLMGEEDDNILGMYHSYIKLEEDHRDVVDMLIRNKIKEALAFSKDMLEEFYANSKAPPK